MDGRRNNWIIQDQLENGEKRHFSKDKTGDDYLTHNMSIVLLKIIRVDYGLELKQVSIGLIILQNFLLQV
jgi:hypothetical protein